jgi:hypothetical protein
MRLYVALKCEKAAFQMELKRRPLGLPFVSVGFQNIRQFMAVLAS